MAGEFAIIEDVKSPGVCVTLLLFCHEKGAVGQAGANQPGWRLFCLERSCLRGFARPRADQAQVFLDAHVAGREAQRLLRQAGALFILPQVI